MESIKQWQFFFCTLLLVGIFLLVGFSNDALAASETNLSKALKSGKKTIEFSGKEKESVKVPKNVTVIGGGVEKAIISGDVTLENGATLKNLTVIGDTTAITLEKGASVRLENVVVRGASDIGIFSPKGGGSLILSNVRVSGNRKGIFLLEGNSISMSGSTISNNREEGLDMHAGSKGSITGSSFLGNKEGGIEVIINGSSLEIQKNTFSDNGASGIALQSYGGGGGGNKEGVFQIKENQLKNNGNFGIDCKNPQGSGGAFFAQSVRAENNVLVGNKKGPINGVCFFVNKVVMEETVLSEEEEKERREEKEKNEEAQLQQETLTQERNQQFVSLMNSEIENIKKEVEMLNQEEKSISKWQQKKLQIKKEILLKKIENFDKKLDQCTPVFNKQISYTQEIVLTACYQGDKQSLRNKSTLEKRRLTEISTVAPREFKELFVNQMERFLEREV